MADARKYNSKLNSKGLEAAVSEDQARHMATHQGNTYVFLVQAHSGKKTVAEDGAEVVQLIPDLVELVPDEHAERIREFQRALYLARPDQFGQEAFDGAAGNEPTIAQTAAQIDAAVERDESGQPTGVWDGDTDGPLDASGPTFVTCDYPDCKLPAEHDGDHDTAEVDESATV